MIRERIVSGILKFPVNFKRDCDEYKEPQGRVLLTEELSARLPLCPASMSLLPLSFLHFAGAKTTQRNGSRGKEKEGRGTREATSPSLVLKAG